MQQSLKSLTIQLSEHWLSSFCSSLFIDATHAEMPTAKWSFLVVELSTHALLLGASIAAFHANHFQ